MYESRTSNLNGFAKLGSNARRSAGVLTLAFILMMIGAGTALAAPATGIKVTPTCGLLNSMGLIHLANSLLGNFEGIVIVFLGLAAVIFLFVAIFDSKNFGKHIGKVILYVVLGAGGLTAVIQGILYLVNKGCAA